MNIHLSDMGTGKLQAGGGRNYAIDFLRILSMFMIMVLHGNAHGGVLSLQTGYDINSLFIHFCESLSIVSVNVFVLISGYYLSTQQVKLSRSVKLITATWFYAWLWLIICLALGDTVGKATIVKNIAPISYGTYWFVSLYIGMFLCSPFINIGIRNMTKRQHGILVLLLVVLFSLLPSLLPLSEPFGIKTGGFNVLWFITLYLIASYISKYGFLNFKKGYWLLGYLSFSVILLIVWFILSKILGVSDFSNEWKGGLNFYYFNYNSILVFLSSICLFRFFLEIDIKNSTLRKIIKAIAPLMLGVYLIHDNRLGREYIWKALSCVQEMTIGALAYIVGILILLFLTCIIVEWTRSKVFSLLLERRIFYKKLLLKIDKFPDWLYSKTLDIG